MENLSRRSFLQTTACAAAGISIPAAALASSQAQELPVDRVNRLAWELAAALNDYADGSMHAVVHPTNVKGNWSVGFVVSEFELSPQKQAEAAALGLKAAMNRLSPGDYVWHLNPELGVAAVIRNWREV